MSVQVGEIGMLKQSSHALWVGRQSVQALVYQLADVFSHLQRVTAELGLCGSPDVLGGVQLRRIGRERVEPYPGCGVLGDPLGHFLAVMNPLDHIVQTGEQLGQLRTHSLGDVATFPPYMHGGQLMNLEEVVHHHNKEPLEARLLSAP